MAAWTASLVPFLPLDVLHLVGRVAQPPELCSMVQANKALNKILTPNLYASVELDSWDAILMCMKTLGSLPKQRSFGRILERHVRSLVIKRPITRKPFYASGGIGETLFKALPLMFKLEHFSSGVALSPCSSNIFYLLATGTCPSLQSMELQVLGEIPTALEEKDPHEIEASALQVPPSLGRLALELPVGTAAQRSFVRQLLRTCTPTLRSLSLAIDGRYVRGIWDHFLPSDADFADLEDLVIDFAALSHPPFQRAVSVQSLKVSHWGRGELSSDVLPDLRTLSCPARQLSAFLPADADRRRPIATVSLGNASYRSPADDSWPNAWDPSSWRDVFAALQHLRYSAVPVTSLTIDVASIPIAGVQAAQPYLTALEYLDVVLHQANTPDYLRMLADELIARLPRLHTLLISHPPPTGGGTHGRSFDEIGLSFTESMRLSRKVILGLEEKPSTLRRLAFSADIEWHKTDGKWRWSGDPQFYRNLGGSLDDPDYDDGPGSAEEEDDEATEDEIGSVYSGPSEDGTLCIDFGYEDEKGVESDEYEDDRASSDNVQEDDGGSGDDGYQSETSEDLEDTRFLPEPVSDREELQYVE